MRRGGLPERDRAHMTENFFFQPRPGDIRQIRIEQHGLAKDEIALWVEVARQINAQAGGDFASVRTEAQHERRHQADHKARMAQFERAALRGQDPLRRRRSRMARQARGTFIDQDESYVPLTQAAHHGQRLPFFFIFRQSQFALPIPPSDFSLLLDRLQRDVGTSVELDRAVGTVDKLNRTFHGGSPSIGGVAEE